MIVIIIMNIANIMNISIMHGAGGTPSLVGWSNSHFNSLRVGIALETNKRLHVSNTR